MIYLLSMKLVSRVNAIRAKHQIRGLSTSPTYAGLVVLAFFTTRCHTAASQEAAPYLTVQTVLRGTGSHLANFGVGRFSRISRYGDHPAFKVNREVSLQFEGIAQIERMNDHVQLKPGEGATKRATAFNLGPCLVLTNDHVVFGGDLTPRENVDYRMVVSAGFARNKPFRGTTVVTSKARGDRGPEGGHDWNLLYSSACLGKRFGWFSVSPRSNAELVNSKARIFVVSFPGDRDVGEMEISFGNITGINPNNGSIMHSASTAPGSSGGPVFVYEEGSMLLVGINKAGVKREDKSYEYDRYTTQYTNYFVNIEEVVNRSDVRKFVKEDLARMGADNPADAYSGFAPPNQP